MRHYKEGLVLLPPHMRDSTVDYIEKGALPGGFLSSVLSNNLVEAAAHADEENQRALFTWATFLHSFAPMRCWGSPEKVCSWIEHGGLRGLEANATLETET